MSLQRIKPYVLNVKFIGLLLVFAAVLLFVRMDSFLYSDTVVKVTSVKNTFAYDREGPNGETEKYYEQELTVKVLNGKYKNKKLVLENTYSKSGVNDERYYRGNQLFVSLSGKGESGSIIGKKRDFYLAVLIGFFVFLLLLINGMHGGIILASVVMNIAIFLVALSEYGQGKDLIRLSYILLLVFTILTLLFAGGFHKKTLAAIIATLATTGICLFIYQIVISNSERLPYEMMDYAVNPNDLADLFLVGVLMGSLGAVMDVCISISAGAAEIMNQTPEISMKALIRSIREMGYDIMGTMINVLFFTFISSAIPVVVIKIKNGYTFFHLMHYQLVFEIIRFLMGAIGIIVAIPVSGFFAVLFIHGGAKKFGKGGKSL